VRGGRAAAGRRVAHLRVRPSRPVDAAAAGLPITRLPLFQPPVVVDGSRPDQGTTMSGNPLPRDRWAAVTVPTLVMHGVGTFPFIVAGTKALAELLPTATLRPVEEEQHDVPRQRVHLATS
jgi:pimeloyl-ACP methyl ester carboxylesterase